MKDRIHAVLIIISFILVPIISGCGGESDSELALLAAGEARVILVVKMPGEELAAKSSIIDRIFSFFSKDAIAQTAPATILYMTVSVTGADIVPSVGYYYPTSQMSLNVLEGNNRKITVTAHVVPGGHPHVFNFQGTATVNITAGVTQTVSITMGAGATKLLIPDYLNNRVVQIDNMSGSGWKTYGTTFPNDVDLDGRGRIFIARNATPELIRIDNIDASSSTTIADVAASVTALAIDRANNWVYYISNNQFYRCDSDGGNSHAAYNKGGSATMGTIMGMYVDDDGNLYIAGYNSLGTPGVFKYDTVAEQVIDSNVSNSTFNNPRDVIVKNNYVVVINASGADGLKLVKLDLNLDNPQGYGNNAINMGMPGSEITPAGYFYDPWLFVAIRNEELIIIDDDTSDAGWDYNRLVSIGDINNITTTWSIYGTTGTGTGQFRFLNSC